MKKMFFLAALLLPVLIYSQSGLYTGFNLQGTSNFMGKTDGAMHQYGGEVVYGYQFSKKIRVGLTIPVTHGIFRANNERFSFFVNGGGLNINTHLLNFSDDFSLRLDVSSSLVDTRRQQEGLGNNQKWFFIKSSAGLQLQGYVDKLDALYISLGMSHYTDTHRYSETLTKRYNFFAPYLSIGFIVSFK